jgi:hypothetical protein
MPQSRPSTAPGHVTAHSMISWPVSRLPSAHRCRRASLGQCPARWSPWIVVRQQRADLIEPEAGRLAEPDHLEAGEYGLVVAPPAAANRALQRRYGWQYDVVPLLKVRGVKNVDHALPLREKLRRTTTKSLWPDSAIVGVKLTPDDARTAAPEPLSIQDGSPPLA